MLTYAVLYILQNLMEVDQLLVFYHTFFLSPSQHFSLTKSQFRLSVIYQQ